MTGRPRLTKYRNQEVPRAVPVMRVLQCFWKGGRPMSDARALRRTSVKKYSFVSRTNKVIGAIGHGSAGYVFRCRLAVSIVPQYSNSSQIPFVQQHRLPRTIDTATEYPGVFAFSLSCR